MITEESDLHPVRLLVNKNLADPGETPVTVPALEIEAISGLDDIHVPPEAGSIVVTDPTQTC
jgi:hypothetical protein